MAGGNSSWLYELGRGSELGKIENNSSKMEPGTAGLRDRRAGHSATLPLVTSTFTFQIRIIEHGAA